MWTLKNVDDICVVRNIWLSSSTYNEHFDNQNNCLVPNPKLPNCPHYLSSACAS